MPSPGVIILDLETTGFDPRKDSIIEIYAVRYWRGKVQEEFSTLIKPKKHIPYKITKLTGLQESDFIEAPTFAEIKDDLYKFVRNKRIIAYNSSFDRRFLIWNDRRFTCLRFLDYLKFMKRKRPNLKAYSLEAVSKYFGYGFKQQHRAKEDVEILIKLIRVFGY
tara:strand:- start:1817 stop:2308 length:492 start_codon:yes stop_codon:yes gene_type:complete